nr:endonuclease [Enterovibrio nigricans]
MLKIKSASIMAIFFYPVVSIAADCQKPEVPAFDSKTYYANIDNTNPVTLKNSLNKIISSNYVKQSYKCVWNMLEEADQDPSNPDNVVLIYSQQSYPKKSRSGSSIPGNKWNREHLWATSHGFPKQHQYAYTDGHHIVASDQKCNALRGDLDFGIGGTLIERCNSSLQKDRTWEPPHENKGDIARKLFYMAVRYDGDLLSNTPDLILSNNLTSEKTPFLGELCDLYKWHKIDPVDKKEISRNNVIYSWQGNRNPFIDNPAWADKIFGNACLIHNRLKTKLTISIKHFLLGTCFLSKKVGYTDLLN